MFNSARLKLTAWYLLIVIFISVSFSSVIYRIATLELERFDRIQRFRIERRLSEGGVRVLVPPMIDPQLVAETKRRILLMLLTVNGGIITLSGVIGYFLAGRTLEPIKEMVEEQNRFISDASHELRTPLTALKSAFEVHLRDKSLTLKQAKRLIAESVNDVDKLSSLSGSLLRLTQYQKTNDLLVFEDVSLPQLIQEAIRRIKPLAKQKEISLTNKAKNISFKGNKNSLVDLLVILFDNAVKYSPKGKKIEIFSEKTEKHVLIVVKDQGTGIDKKDLPYIFDRFYRSDSARTKQGAGGYGLGLSIAQKIVQEHQGAISVDSKLNKGTVFKVFLPLK